MEETSARVAESASMRPGFMYRDPDHGGHPYRFKVGQESEPGAPSTALQEPLLHTLGRLHEKARRQFVAGWLPNGLLLGLDPVLPELELCRGCLAAGHCLPGAMSYCQMDRAIAAGRALGLRFFLYVSRYPAGYGQEILDLALKHEDCFFVVLGRTPQLERELAASLAEAGNVAFVLDVNGTPVGAARGRRFEVHRRMPPALEILQEEGTPFGFSACYQAHNYEEVLSEELLALLLRQGALFGLLYPHLRHHWNVPAPLALTEEQRRRKDGIIRRLRERSPISLLDIDRDVVFSGEQPAGDGPGPDVGPRYAGPAGAPVEQLRIHYVDGGQDAVTLLESLQLAAQAGRALLRRADEERRRQCPASHDPLRMTRMVTVNLQP
jgi:hypothetical protein